MGLVRFDYRRNLMLVFAGGGGVCFACHAPGLSAPGALDRWRGRGVFRRLWHWTDHFALASNAPTIINIEPKVRFSRRTWLGPFSQRAMRFASVAYPIITRISTASVVTPRTRYCDAWGCCGNTNCGNSAARKTMLLGLVKLTNMPRRNNCRRDSVPFAVVSCMAPAARHC